MRYTVEYATLVAGLVAAGLVVVGCGDKSAKGDGPRCGNGRVELHEVCDDGNNVSGDGCSANCKSTEFCGNGLLDIAVGEECEDRNLIDGDGCSATCQDEDGVATCGNGFLEIGEECDDGNTNSADGCSTACQWEFVCGDGFCDEANGERCAFCPEDCCPGCGNGQPDAGEQCDDGAANSDTEPDACRTDCTPARCGDYVIDSGEGCDSGHLNSDIDPDACRPDCAPAACGDGIVDSGEACDNGAANSDTEPDACRNDCTPAGCGDGVIDSGEVCDGSNLAGETCQSAVSLPFGELSCAPGCQGLDTAGCHACGDGTCDTANGEGSQSCAADCGWVTLAGGNNHTCGVRVNGTAWCWGMNSSGQLGQAPSPYSNVPVQVSGLSSVGDLAAGSQHNCAIVGNGDVWCWGWNGYGQLGSGTVSDESYLPVQVQGLSGVVAVSSAGYHSCAIDSNGDVWCWGSNYYGQLGDGQTYPWCGGYGCSPTPVQVSGLQNVSIISLGAVHSCGKNGNGDLWCWGKNGYGQLGVPTSMGMSTLPVHVSFQGLNGAAMLSLGNSHTCAIDSNGDVWCWGGNLAGELGDGQTHQQCGAFDCSPTPVQVLGLTNATHLSSGGLFSCAQIPNGSLWCWGSNYRGQLGHGTTGGDYNFPVQVQGLTAVTALASGNNHLCALDGASDLWCWGHNANGQLGNGTTDSTNVPVLVSDP